MPLLIVRARGGRSAEASQWSLHQHSAIHLVPWLDIQPTTGRVTTVTAGRRTIGTRFSDPPGRNYSREIFSTVPYDPFTVNIGSIAHRNPALPT